MSETSRNLVYADETIAFNLIFSTRKTIDISVHPDKRVTVKAPSGTAIEEIEKRVKNRARWILKQQQYFSQFEPRSPAPQYTSGETHLYLGRKYHLKVEQHPHSSVKLKGGYLYLQTPQPDYIDTTRTMLDNWYLERAEIKFSDRLDLCFLSFKELGFPRPNLHIRKLTKRWGSMTSTGKIILNRELIKAPYRCIDYVITHELCHLKHPNHSRHFYSFLSSLMPDWEERKLKLEQLLSQLTVDS